jgi:hypothetical protein
MTDETIRVALYVLGSIGGLSVICIGVLIAALAVLASIASAAVGGVAGMTTPRQQGPSSGSLEETLPPSRPQRAPDGGQ